MKRLIIAMVVVLMPLVGNAQTEKTNLDKGDTATKLESFITKKGSMHIKDSYPIDDFSESGNIEFTALVIYEPGENKNKTKGIRIEITERGRFEKSNAAFIDIDELPSLSSALAYMIDLSKKWKESNRETYTEVTFSTKGDYNVGFYMKNKEPQAFASAGIIGKATMFPNIEQLARIKTAIDNGLNILKAK